jgi:predicted nuclease of predicted toxin-antitoxin system
MRFLTDENISNFVVNILVADGHDVVLVRHGHEGSDDPFVLNLADQSRRILITEDRDFGELVVRQKLPVGGILLLELDQLSNQAEAERVRVVVASEGELLMGHLVVVEAGRLRRRKLSS